MASEYDDGGGRSDIPWTVKLVGIIVLGIVVWLAVGFIFATLRFALAIAGYIIVGFLGYELGKWVGRGSSKAEP